MREIALDCTDPLAAHLRNKKTRVLAVLRTKSDSGRILIKSSLYLDPYWYKINLLDDNWKLL